MRITNKLISSNFLADMQKNLQNLNKIQQQVSSMKNFSKPSDDPVNVERAMQLQTSLNANDQYGTNINSALNWMQTTDTTLGQIGDVLTKVRTNLVASGDAPYNQDELDKLNDEVNQEVSQLAQLLNTNFKGEYIFGGTAGNSKPVETVSYDISRNSTDSSGNAVSDYTDCVSIKYTNKDGDVLEDIPQVVSNQFDIDNWKGAELDFTVNGGASVPLTVSSEDSNIDDVIKDLNSQIQSSDLKDKVNVVKTNDDNIKFLAVDSGDSIKLNTDIYDMQQKLNTVDIYGDKDSLSSINGKTLNFSIKTADGVKNLGLTINVADPDASDAVDNVIENLNTQLSSDENFNGKISISKTSEGNIEISSNDSTVTLSTDITDMNSLSYGNSKQLSSMDMENISSSKNIEVSQGVVLSYNASATSIMNYGSGSGDNIEGLMDRIVHNLAGMVQSTTDTSGNKVTGSTDGAVLGSDGNYYVWKYDESAAKEQLEGEDVSDIDAASKQVLKVRSQIGAKEDRMEDLSNQNSSTKLDLTDVLSKTEDIDITEKTTEYYTMITVYQACLQTGAKIIQPTLMDYIK